MTKTIGWNAQRSFNAFFYFVGWSKKGIIRFEIKVKQTERKERERSKKKEKKKKEKKERKQQKI